MRRPSFIEGVVVAVIGALLALIISPLLRIMLPLANYQTAIISLLCFTYIGYLLARSPYRVGRVSAVLLWIMVTVTSVLAGVSTLELLGVQLVLIWLVRSLFFYRSLACALLDLALIVLSTAFAYWGLIQTGSAVISLWCLLLGQAVFSFIPIDLRSGVGRESDSSSDNQAGDRFERAYQTAQNALRQTLAARD